MATTTNTTLPAAVQQDFAMRLLSVPTPQYIMKIPAMKDKLRKNNGPIKRYRRYNPLDSALVPLGNSGVTPPASQLTATDIDARIDYYGDYVELNEQTVKEAQESVLNEASIRLGIGMRQTEDELTSNMMASTASQLNCTNGLGGSASPTAISGQDIGRVIRTLRGNNAKMFFGSIEGADKFDTSPIRNAFVALSHTNMENDLERIQDFHTIDQYPDQDKVLPSEWGAYRNVRFFTSTLGSREENAASDGATVYNNFVLGQEAIACIEADATSTQLIYRPAQFSGPLAQNVTLGYKLAEVPRILNDAWIVNLRATLAS